MNSENSTNQTNKLSREQLAYQIEALGNLAFEALNNCEIDSFVNDFHTKNWRKNVCRIAAGVHVFCQSIEQQILAEGASTDLINRSLAFQIEAVGDSAVNSLEFETIHLMGGSVDQRIYVDGVAQSIKVFCDSIADQLRSEADPEAEQ